MLKTAKLILVISFSCLLNACGFELPSQEDLSKAVPKLNVEGDYHSSFYKYVVQKLRMAGVEVNSQNSDYYQNDSEVPTLMIPTSHVETKVVAVDSMAQSLEENMLISVAATLSIKGHKPILIKNSLTRSILNKSGFALASQTEKDTVIDETYQELASQMVLRISYLGRQSDPTSKIPQPADLLVNEDSDFAPQSSIYEGMTIIEALQAQDHLESAQGTQVTLDELNNQQEILGNSTTPKLPPIKPVLRHEAPASLDTRI